MNGRDGQNGRDGREVGVDLSMGSIKSMPSIASISSPSIPSISSPSMPSISSPPTPFAEIAANGAHALVGVACRLLDRQVARLAADFESEGGFSERLYRVRTANRRNR